MKVHRTPISELLVVEPNTFNDKRGSFAKLYCQEQFQEVLGNRTISQINQSSTCKVGTVRGLHFQCPPHAEMKIVRCLSGKVWDVAVDLRFGSPTFLKWHAEELSPENTRMMIVPEGCAHGFQVLEANSELLYFHTANYSVEGEGGVHPNDPSLAIHWPLEVINLSDRDLNHKMLQPEYFGVSL